MSKTFNQSRKVTYAL